MQKEHEPDAFGPSNDQYFEDDAITEKIPAKYRDLLEAEWFEKFKKSEDWWD